jgi:long-chain acyl-CoA synthetase
MSYLPSKFQQHLVYPQIPLYQFLMDAVRRTPEKPAIICLDQVLTYRDLLQKSRHFAQWLLYRGIARGDRVMIALWNVPEFAIAFYGTLMAGAVVTTAHPLSQREELAHLLKDSGARFLVADPQLLPVIHSLPSDAKPEVVVEGRREAFEDVFGKSATMDQRVPVGSPLPDDLAVIQYTGGTTGLPKGAMMSHLNLVANAIQNATWWSWTENDIVMGVLALGHTWGLCCCLNSVLCAGATVILVPRFDPVEVLDLIESHQASIIYGSATMFHHLCDALEQGGGDLSSLRLAKAGAMPVPAYLVERWERLAGMPLTLGYGLTEASPETHNSPPDRPKPGSIGVPIFDTEAKIVDPENAEQELPIGEIGELCVRGPQVCRQYWNKPQETGETFRDGWLRTGDLARRDKEGYFYLMDRLKDLIKHRGYSVFPAELEAIMLRHPGVKECLVVGEADHVAGEIPIAYVVPNPNCPINTEELLRYCAEHISPLKTIRKVIFKDVLPRTPVGKGLRRVLRSGIIDKK